LVGVKKILHPSIILIIIGEINDGTERHCFNCWAKQTSQWYNYLKGQYLCEACFTYRRRHKGKLRPQELLLRAKKVTQKYLKY